MADWQSWTEKLERAGEDEVDDLIDELAARLLGSPPAPSATAVAIKAMAAARSDLTFRTAVTALAYVAANDDTQAVAQLEQAFDARRGNVFLAPSVLSALGLLGIRSATARAGAIRYLLRLTADDPRPLLVTGEKIIGLLCERENEPSLRAKLFALAESDDVAVRAEGRQQIALLRLADAFLADSNSGLIAALTAAREAFKLAENSEEIRPDATLLRLLIDAILQFDDLERDRKSAAVRVGEVAGQLRGMGGRLAEQTFRMDRSPAASQVASRCVVIASALESATQEVAQATRWTNYDRSVVRLAECYGEIRYRPEALTGNEQTILAGSSVADRALKPRLGPVLARKVGRESFEQVIRNYEVEQGPDEVLAGLRALQQAALEAERTEAYQLSEETVGLLSAMADKAGCIPEELISRFNLSIGKNDGHGLAIRTELLPPSPGKRGKKMMLPTIGIIVALLEEFDAIRLMIANERRHRADGPGGSREYLLGDIPSTREGIHQVVIAQTLAMGNNSAAMRATKLLTDFDGIDAIIMCGIAGGVPHPAIPQDHVRLGDIVVSDRMGVVQYDLGKEKDRGFDHRHPPRPPSARLLEAVQILEQDRRAGHRPWDEHLRVGLAKRSITMPDASTDVVLDKNKKVIDHPDVPGPIPHIFYSAIASANVVQGNYRKRDKLRDKFKVKAVEMEGSGIADATWEYEKAGYLVVRGICDYCDVRTKPMQTDAWKSYAAMVAAAYVRALLEAIPGVPAADQGSPSAPLSEGKDRSLPEATGPSMFGQRGTTESLKVLVAGSCKNPQTDGEYQSFVRVCELLGERLARAGHIIITGSSETDAADYNVLVGASQTPQRSRVILLRPTQRHEDDRLQAVLKNLDVERRFVKGKWSDIRDNQVKVADVVIIIGGGSGTKAIAELTNNLNKPLFPIAVFGGTARDSWSSIRDKLKKCGLSAETLETLDRGVEVQIVVDSLTLLVQGWSTGEL